MRSTLIIDGSNLTGAGSQALAASLLPALAAVLPDFHIEVMLPAALVSPNWPPNVAVNLTNPRRGLLNDVDRLLALLLKNQAMAVKKHASVWLTLGDLPSAAVRCPQVLFVQQPLLVYSQQELDGQGGWSLLKRLYLHYHFLLTVPSVQRFLVQTPVMADRLARTFGLDPRSIAVISQPAPAHVLHMDHHRDFGPIAENKKRIKLLFLSRFYKHKNHAVLPAVAEELRSRRLDRDVHIFLTLSEDELNSLQIRQQLKQYPDVITNLGWIVPHDVASALGSSSGLFLPTMAESYGLVYLEALQRGIPVLTSDRDFARFLCRDLAIYFEPRDPVSIVNAIVTLMETERDSSEIRQQVGVRMKELPGNWTEVASAFAQQIRQAAPVDLCNGNLQ